MFRHGGGILFFHDAMDDNWTARLSAALRLLLLCFYSASTAISPLQDHYGLINGVPAPRRVISFTNLKTTNPGLIIS